MPLIYPLKTDIINMLDKQACIEYNEVRSVLLLIRKRTIFCSLGVLCFFAVFSAIMWAGSLRTPTPVFLPSGGAPMIVVIDPGHGGEDGGAVSRNGVEESDINLSVAQKVDGCLRFAGIPTVMIRRSDVMVCDPGLSAMRERKVSDIHNRAAMVNDTPNAVLLSVHQNSLPSSTGTHGAQAFWNEKAELWALGTQELLNGCINDRPKATRRIPKNIYLMNHVAVPALLVECGFLSNPQETELLQTQTHQMKLAAAMTAGYLRWCAGEGES